MILCFDAAARLRHFVPARHSAYSAVGGMERPARRVTAQDVRSGSVYGCCAGSRCNKKEAVTGINRDHDLLFRIPRENQRLLNWKLRRAFALPYFFRSTARESRVRNPATFRMPRKSGS
jgi:hypothetical protein